MLAAEAAHEALQAGRGSDELAAYPEAFRASWLYDELHRARNFKPWMSKGLYTGSLMVGVDQVLFRGKAPWTLRHNVPTRTLKTRPARSLADRLSQARWRADLRPPLDRCSSRTPITTRTSRCTSR
jgi:flavin-dependent dehydrogenase